MKVLIGYDGTEMADAALEDLRRAGMPEDVEALVLAVENEYPVYVLTGFDALEADERDSLGSSRPIDKGGRAESAIGLALRGAEKLKLLFPSWNVQAEGTLGSPYSDLLRVADQWMPDLVVVGSHGRGLLGRAIFGSVSHFVVNHATCGVRVSRAPLFKAETPLHLIVGLDGSEGALAAIDAVAQRNWPAGTSVEVVIALDARYAYLIPEYDFPVSRWGEIAQADAKVTLEKLASRSVARLRSAGLQANYHIYNGDAKSVLLDVAEEKQADCIFLGAKGHSAIERFVIGSVSAGVAGSAPCSVEIVRPKGNAD